MSESTKFYKITPKGPVEISEAEYEREEPTDRARIDPDPIDPGTEQQRLAFGLDLTQDERRQARDTISRTAIVKNQRDAIAMQRLCAEAYANFRATKLARAIVATSRVEAELRDAKEFPPVVHKPENVRDDGQVFDIPGRQERPADELPAFPVRPPERPALLVTRPRGGRMLRLECGGLVAFLDPIEVASINSTRRPGYGDGYEALTVISIRGGLCIQVPTYTADEVFEALAAEEGKR